MNIQNLIFNFFFFLCGGTFISMGFLRQTAVGRNYFIYHAGGAAVLAFINYLVLGRTALSFDATLWYLGFAFSALIYSFSVTKHRRTTLISYFLGALFTLGALVVHDIETMPLPSYFFLINSLLSMLLLGFTLNAMLLGHWYLIQPDLPIAELKRISFIMLVLMGIRFLYSIYPLQEILSGKSEMQIYNYFLSTTKGVFLLMRFSWGILAPLVFGYLIWNTVKIRSTQSATGILYVAVLAVLTGEILSLYLAQFHGISL